MSHTKLVSMLPFIANRAPFSCVGMALLLPVALGWLTGCDRQPPLVPELATISCPADRAKHVRTQFGKAELTFVCVTAAVVDKPALLRCDPNTRPMYCEDSGTFVFSRLPGGKIVPDAPMNARGYEPGPVTDPETDTGSLFEASFYDKPPGKANYDVNARQYLRDDDKQRMPPGFTLVNGPVCDRVSNALDRGTCRLEAKTASLHWYVNVSIPRARGNEIDDTLYQKDMVLWLNLLGKMVTDPKV